MESNPTPTPGNVPPTTPAPAPGTGSAAPSPTATTPPAAPPPKKKRGVFKWVFIVLLLLIAAGAVVLYLNLNKILHRTIETQSEASLNLPTSLGGVNLAIFGGSLDLSQFNIGSPEGFQAPQMFSLGDADVNVNYGDLRGDPVRIQSISLNAPKLVVEQKGGKFNFQTLMDMPSKSPPPEEDGTSEPLRLIIDKLTVTNAEVELRPGIPGLAESYNVKIPPIDLQNIGTGEGNQNGAEIKEVMMGVITAMSAKASESDQVPEELRQLLALNVDQVAEKLGGEINKQVEQISGKLKEQVQGELQKGLDQLPPDVKDKVQTQVNQRVGELIKKDGTSTTQPGKAVEQGVKDLLGGIEKKREEKK